MNIVLMYNSLNNRLCYNLISWYLNSFGSSCIIILSRSMDLFKLNMSIRLSIKLDVHIFPLYVRLDICIIIYFSAWSGNSFISGSFLNDRFSIDRCSLLINRLLFNKINFFCIINNLFLVNWLSIYFFSRCLNNFIYNFFLILNRSGLNWHIVNLSLSSVNL